MHVGGGMHVGGANPGGMRAGSTTFGGAQANFRGAQASSRGGGAQFAQGGFRQEGFRGDRDRGWGRGAGFVAGLAAGSALGYGYGYSDPYYYGDTYAYNDYYDGGDYATVYPAEVGVVAQGSDPSYCAQRYRSYDPATGTYLGFDGLRHPCP